MPITVSSIQTFLNFVQRFKEAITALKKSNLFLKETDIYSVIENYFGFKELSQKKVKLVGRISNYTLSNKFPVYNVLDFKNVKQQIGGHAYNQQAKQLQAKISLELMTTHLQIPCISHRNLVLDDKSNATLLWLYPDNNNGLDLQFIGGGLNNSQPLESLFKISDLDRPIPILADRDTIPQQFFYKSVTIIGKLVTAPISKLDVLANSLDSFQLNYFGNFFRPFSNAEGFLAIDIRKPDGNISINNALSNKFLINYTVQATIELPITLSETQKDWFFRYCVDAIPDRQGMGPLTSMGSQHDNNVKAIVSIGDISWQYQQLDNCMSAFITIDANNPNDFQTKMTALTYHWQSWQKKARELIRNNINVEPKIRPLICSNVLQEKNFHPNGLQISEQIEKQLLNNNPNIRSSIDWLGISTGRK